MAKLKYSLGKTLNLGNYENVKVDIGIELDCDEDELNEKWEEAKEFIEKKMEEEEYRWKV